MNGLELEVCINPKLKPMKISKHNSIINDFLLGINLLTDLNALVNTNGDFAIQGIKLSEDRRETYKVVIPYMISQLKRKVRFIKIEWRSSFTNRVKTKLSKLTSIVKNYWFNVRNQFRRLRYRLNKKR